MQHQLKKGVAAGHRQLLVDDLGAGQQLVVVGHHAGPLPRCQAVGVGIQQLGLAAGVVLGVSGQDIGNRRRVLRSKLLVGPALRVSGYAVGRNGGGVPGVVEKKGNRQFHGLQVAHVHHPNLVGTVVVGQVHLLPDARQRVCVQPLVVAWSAHVVEVVVDAVAALARLVGQFGQLAQVAPVVVAQQQGHVVGHAHAFVVVVLHLLVEGPHLRRLVGGLVGFFGDDLALVSHYFFEQGNVAFPAHGLVAVAAHAHRHDVLAGAHAPHATAPEATQRGVVGLVVPGFARAKRLPFFVGAGQRLVVGSAHHDAVPIGQLRVQRVVHVEHVAPHGRPQVVALESQNQLKHMAVHL